MPNGAVFVSCNGHPDGGDWFFAELERPSLTENFFVFPNFGSPNFGSKRFYELDKSGVTWILVLAVHKTKRYSLAVHICIHRSWMLQNFKGLKWKSASFQDSDKLLPWTSGCQPRLTPHRLSRKGEGEIWTHMPFSETKLSSYSKKRNFLMKARLTSGWL